MKALAVVVVFIILAALFGLGGDDSEQPVPIVADHNKSHDCSQGLAESFLFGAATMLFGGAHKVIGTDTTRVMVCMDLDGDGVCEPQTIFSCRNAVQLVLRDAERNGLHQVTPETAREILHWPIEQLVLAALMGVVIVAALMPQRKAT